MAHTISVKKRIRQAEKAKLYNRRYKSIAKNAIKNVQNAKSKEEALPLLKEATSIIDKLVSKGVFHKNTASKKKSKLNKYFNSLS